MLHLLFDSALLFTRFFFRKKHLVYDVKKCIFVEIRILIRPLYIIHFDYGD